MLGVNLYGEGGEVAGSKGGEGVEDQGVGEGGEVAEGLGGEGDDVAISEGDESDGGGEERDDVTVSEGGESDGGGKKGIRDESDNEPEDESAYLMKVMYLPDGDDDEELQEARQKVREVEGKTSGKGRKWYFMKLKVSSGKQFEAKVLEEVDGEGLNDSVSREEDGNETEYFDSDDHGSILGLEDDDNIEDYRRRSRFPHTIQT
ncbi:hypothetical protein V6Z12_D11G223700 [Gossypium hirsutum]